MAKKKTQPKAFLLAEMKDGSINLRIESSSENMAILLDNIAAQHEGIRNAIVYAMARILDRQGHELYKNLMDEVKAGNI